MVCHPRNQKGEWDDDGIIRKLGEYERGHELVLANVIRDSIKKWRADDYPGVTCTIYYLLHHWCSPKQSQALCALLLNVSVETVRAWEQGRRTPEGSALRLLQVADASPEVLLRNVDVK